MQGKWCFKEVQPGYKDRQPSQGEFFATDAISSSTEALVRESIQNSLDARIKESTPAAVRVRFFLATGEFALPSKQAMKYFTSGWEHFSDDENGLDDVPQNTSNCDYLVVEDFGTTGLNGDVHQYIHTPKVNNQFFYFFRTEGRSGKCDGEIGRWGIGKYVYPRSSRIHAFFALTVRHDDNKRLLMGQTILKSHAVDNKYFTPDGDFGLVAGNGLVLPVEDKETEDGFCTDFRLKRVDESGLSVVVPWVDTGEITFNSLLGAIIKGYFCPILRGQLVVTVGTGNEEQEINAETIETLCELFDEEFKKKILPTIQLTRWAFSLKETDCIKLNPANPLRPQWEASLLPLDQINDLRLKYRAGSSIAVEIPLTVRARKVPDAVTYFRFFLVNNGSDDGCPTFIREGLIISDVRGHRVQGVCSIVVIEHSALANLLGDSENPAHTQWQRDRDHFKYKYTYGKSYIDFVTQCVSRFIELLNAEDKQPDRTLLNDLFFIPKALTSDEPKEKARPRKRNKGDVIVDVPKIEPKKRRFTLTKVSGGFIVTRGSLDAVLPPSINVVVAYDRRRGSPINKYSTSDFRLTHKPILISTKSAKLVASDLNRLIVRILDSDFRLEVTGFDENRDLFVGVTAKEDSDDPQA